MGWVKDFLDPCRCMQQKGGRGSRSFRVTPYNATGSSDCLIFRSLVCRLSQMRRSKPVRMDGMDAAVVLFYRLNRHPQGFREGIRMNAVCGCS